MVKIGFIVEGAVDKMILGSRIFQEYLTTLGIDFIKDVVDAGGNGNLLPHNIEKHTKILEDKGATKIFILTDLDADQCITLTKERINSLPNQTVAVSIKEVEAWFLADVLAMQTLLIDPSFTIDNPEVIENPFEEIRRLRVKKTGRGVGSKVILAYQMIDKCGFSIIRAAEHPNCSSAKYFLNKLQEIAAKA